MRVSGWMTVAVLCMAAVAPARAEFTLAGGIEYFSWVEDTSPIGVKENGPLLAFDIGYTTDQAKGFVFAYRGHFYAGQVDYEGALLFAPSVPVSATTNYVGAANEAQLRWRVPIERGYRMDILGGLGLDLWQRQLSADQVEDYTVVYARLGVEVSSGRALGWLAAGGLKYPLYTREDAHLTDVGFDQNPILTPGKSVSAFARLGYRFTPHWTLIGYYEGYRFSQSNEEPVSIGGVFAGWVSQPASNMNVFGLSLQYTF